MKLQRLGCVAVALMGVLAAGNAAAAETDLHFTIRSFAIEGNTLLSAEEGERLVSPFVGEAKTYGDVQRALEALENRYHSLGYGTVQVYVPEQELTQGVVRLKVTEGVVGTVSVGGNTAFPTDNIRASLPQLREGAAPNMRALSANVQLANENPAKQVDVILSVGEREGEVNAKVQVEESPPLKFIVSLDDTGNAATGQHRLGLAVQHANLFGQDEVLTAAYSTSPDVRLNHPDNVRVDIYSLAFHKPLYGLGDSIDVIYGNSNVDTPISQATGFGVIGKGEVLALRWNHLFPRRGEYTGRLVFGVDYKFTRTTLDAAGISLASPYTVRTLSATYSGQIVSVGFAADYSLGALHNLPVGAHNAYVDNQGNVASDRYSDIARREVDDRFTALRYGGSYVRGLGDWQVRAALSGQHAFSGLPDTEQLGLVGANAVRGFEERVAAADSAQIINLELYSPELADKTGLPGSLRALAFVDAARGRNIDLLAGGDKRATEGVGSWGMGLRYALDKNASLKFDVAQVRNRDQAATEHAGDWRGHFTLTFVF